MILLMKKILLLLALSFLPLPAQAQESPTFLPPGSKWENEAADTAAALARESLREEGGVIPNVVELSIVHHPYMEPAQFGLQMKVPNVSTGCFELSPIEYKANFIEGLYMDIDIAAYKRTPVKTQDVAYGCPATYRAASTLIVLDAEDLRARGVRQIRLSNGNARDIYNVYFRPGAIKLEPESMIVFKVKNGMGPTESDLVYQYGQTNIVALQVPMAKKGDNIEAEIRALAAQNALNPVVDASLLPVEESESVFYFTDDAQAASALMGEQGYAELGEIPVLRPYVSANGREERAVPLKVFITRHDMVM
jgi:hypothetical protein